MLVKSSFRDEAVRADVAGEEVLLVLVVHVILVLLYRGELGTTDGAGQTTRPFTGTLGPRQLTEILPGESVLRSTPYLTNYH